MLSCTAIDYLDIPLSYKVNTTVSMEQLLEQQLMAAANVVEQQLNSEIEKLDKMDKDELEILRERRIAAMKKAEDQKKTWIANGHGK